MDLPQVVEDRRLGHVLEHKRAVDDVKICSGTVPGRSRCPGGNVRSADPGDAADPVGSSPPDVNAMHVAAHRCHMLHNSTDSAADLKKGAVWGKKGTDAFSVLTPEDVNDSSLSWSAMARIAST